MAEKEDLGLSLGLSSSTPENRHPLRLNLMPWNDFFASRGTLMWSLRTFSSPFCIFSFEIFRSRDRLGFCCLAFFLSFRSGNESYLSFFPILHLLKNPVSVLIFVFVFIYFWKSLDPMRNPVFDALFFAFAFLHLRVLMLLPVRFQCFSFNFLKISKIFSARRSLDAFSDKKDLIFLTLFVMTELLTLKLLFKDRRGIFHLLTIRSSRSLT